MQTILTLLGLRRTINQREEPESSTSPPRDTQAEGPATKEASIPGTGRHHRRNQRKRAKQKERRRKETALAISAPSLASRDTAKAVKTCPSFPRLSEPSMGYHSPSVASSSSPSPSHPAPSTPALVASVFPSKFRRSSAPPAIQQNLSPEASMPTKATSDQWMDETKKSSPEPDVDTVQPLQSAGNLQDKSTTVLVPDELPSLHSRIERTPIQFDSYRFLCVRPDCGKSTSPYDGSTVICPICGPYSWVRYCSKQCLYIHSTLHCLTQCSRFRIQAGIDQHTIAGHQINIPRPIPDIFPGHHPERHRQMVRHCLDQSADYFIFRDGMEWMASGSPADWTQSGSGPLLQPVSFEPLGSSVPDRRTFKRLLAVCFLFGPARPDMSRWLFKCVRLRLWELGELSGEVLECLIWQIMRETQLDTRVLSPSALRCDAGSEDWGQMAVELFDVLEHDWVKRRLEGPEGLGEGWRNGIF